MSQRAKELRNEILRLFRALRAQKPESDLLQFEVMFTAEEPPDEVAENWSKLVPVTEFKSGTETLLHFRNVLLENIDPTKTTLRVV